MLLTNLGLSTRKSLRHVQDVEMAKRSDGSLEFLVNMQVLEEKEQWNTLDAQNALTRGAEVYDALAEQVGSYKSLFHTV